MPDAHTLEALLCLLALLLALGLRPWRMLAGQAAPLLTPLLATLVLLPWVWALPALVRMPLPLQWSGACLVLLLLGWPLAVLALLATGVIAWVLAPGLDASTALGITAWHGVVPATLGLLLGSMLRRLTGTRPFVYVLGRAFLGTVLCLFLSGLLAQWAQHRLPSLDDPGLTLVARWLMAWSDGIVTGMLTAVFVAFKPDWLATWSDRLYLAAPPDPDTGSIL